MRERCQDVHTIGEALSCGHRPHPLRGSSSRPHGLHCHHTNVRPPTAQGKGGPLLPCGASVRSGQTEKRALACLCLECIWGFGCAVLPGSTEIDP